MQVASTLRHCSVQHLQNTYACDEPALAPQAARQTSRLSRTPYPPSHTTGAQKLRLRPGSICQQAILPQGQLVPRSSGLDQAAFVSRQFCHRGCMQQGPNRQLMDFGCVTHAALHSKGANKAST